MEDFIKVTKLACKVTVKWLRPKKILEITKRRECL